MFGRAKSRGNFRDLERTSEMLSSLMHSFIHRSEGSCNNTVASLGQDVEFSQSKRCLVEELYVSLNPMRERE